MLLIVAIEATGIQSRLELQKGPCIPVIILWLLTLVFVQERRWGIGPIPGLGGGCSVIAETTASMDLMTKL